jgi:inner membrane protein
VSELPRSDSRLQPRFKSGSMGVKLMVICGLALLMIIPMLFVAALIEDRSNRAADVVREISAHVGGQQIFLGPTLAIPYSIAPRSPLDSEKHGMYLVFPTQASAVLNIATEERYRSLFKVPVFQADLNLDATFDLTGVPTAVPTNVELDWSRSEIVVGVSDARGALADATISTDGKSSTLVPATIAQNVSIGGDPSSQLKLTLFGANVEGFAKPNAQFNVKSALRFSGAQRIAVLAYGKTTHLAVKGDWPSPGFDGGFLPTARDVSTSGFTAQWSVPFIARGVRAEGQSDLIAGLDATALGISFIEVADPYQSVNRSLKYAPLFLGLVFLSYFVFEATTGKRVHPAQYVLVGVAQTIFYLLLLSLAERIGFGSGFLIAGAATVILLSVNAAWIFSSRLQGIRSCGIFTLLYGLIYMLLRLEDNALLVGAIASFLAVATVMYFTRGIDWYASLLARVPSDGQIAPPLPRQTANDGHAV